MNGYQSTYTQASPYQSVAVAPPLPGQRFSDLKVANEEWVKTEKKDKTTSVACIAVGITLMLIGILMLIFLLVWHLADTTLSTETKKKLDNVKIAMLVIFSVIILIGLIVMVIGFFIRPPTFSRKNE